MSPLRAGWLEVVAMTPAHDDLCWWPEATAWWFAAEPVPVCPVDLV